MSRYLDLVEYLQARLGVVIDEAASEPFVYLPNTLYAWEEGQDSHPVDSVREDFRIRLVYAVDSGDEEPMQQRTRPVSQAMEDIGRAIISDIRTSVGDEPWEYATVDDVDPDYLRGLNVRGFSLVVAGWRLV